MNRVIKAKYSGGIIKLGTKYHISEGKELFVVVEKGNKGSILDETFGLWMDTPDFLENIRNESEDRMKSLGLP